MAATLLVNKAAKHSVSGVPKQLSLDPKQVSCRVSVAATLLVNETAKHSVAVGVNAVSNAVLTALAPPSWGSRPPEIRTFAEPFPTLEQEAWVCCRAVGVRVVSERVL